MAKISARRNLYLFRFIQENVQVYSDVLVQSDRDQDIELIGITHP